MVKRYAFSMIELIFAIVIIAVIVMSLAMMRQVTSKSALNNLSVDESAFEAYVKALEATDQTFDTLSSTTKTSIIGSGEAGTLEGIKFDNQYDINVTNPASFGLDSNSDDIKKVTVTIYDENNKTITKLYTYKFNF